jgi:hypothetical protein
MPQGNSNEFSLPFLKSGYKSGGFYSLFGDFPELGGNTEFPGMDTRFFEKTPGNMARNLLIREHGENV